MDTFIKKYIDTRSTDVAIVGGKNASPGEMTAALSSQGIKVPDGFATTAYAFWTFLDFNKLWEHLLQLMQELDRENFSNLQEKGTAARKLIMDGTMPDMIAEEIRSAYRYLKWGNTYCSGRESGATAEDMPQKNKDGAVITVSCIEEKTGFVYEGKLKCEEAGKARIAGLTRM